MIREEHLVLYSETRYIVPEGESKTVFLFEAS